MLLLCAKFTVFLKKGYDFLKLQSKQFMILLNEDDAVLLPQALTRLHSILPPVPTSSPWASRQRPPWAPQVTSVRHMDVATLITVTDQHKHIVLILHHLHKKLIYFQTQFKVPVYHGVQLI
ncbi:hypothetical protein L345_01961, partial [Ophiophagus hannah]